MPCYVDLETLTGFGVEADAALVKIVRAVMQANTWSVNGIGVLRGGPTGYHLDIPAYPGPISAVAGSGGITAAAGDTLGSGPATLRHRDGVNLFDGATVTVLSNFTVAIPEDTRIEIAPDGDEYKLLGSDCVA